MKEPVGLRIFLDGGDLFPSHSVRGPAFPTRGLRSSLDFSRFGLCGFGGVASIRRSTSSSSF